MTRIAVLGGGPAGLAAAWHLIHAEPDLEITVFQQGWRLGGKGAAGRGPSMRIEEHGIHLFGNFYGNALGMVRAAHLETGRSLDEALLPNNLHMSLDLSTGRRYSARVAAAELESTARGDDNIHPELLGRKLFEAGIEALIGMTPIPDGVPGPLSRLNARVRRSVADLLASNVVTKGTARRLEQVAPVSGSPSQDTSAYRRAARRVQLFRTIAKTARFLQGRPSWEIRHAQADLVFTALAGALADRVFSLGIDSIDDQDYLAWLKRHGLHEATARSEVVRSIPNICFQYPSGDTSRPPEMSAAAFLTFVLRQLAAPGPNFWYFRRGTGESVILPVYDALVRPPQGRRPVRFEFFTRVTDVVPAADGSTIERIHLRRHARPLDEAYDPIVERDGIRHWPSGPVLERLDPSDAAAIEGLDLEDWYSLLPAEPGSDEVLELGRDFDAVVLALPPPTHRWSCPSLLADPTWAEMVDGLEFIATQGVQLWLTPAAPDLGLPAEPYRVGTERWSTAEWATPNSCWVDFTDLVAEERWERPPGTLVYFCGPLDTPLPDPGDVSVSAFPAEARDRVVSGTRLMLDGIHRLLPGATQADGRIRSDLLAEADPNRIGSDPLLGQYLRANVVPTERYGLSLPGMLRYRRKPWESGFENLVLAGDWTFTGLNINSFEGAVTSGALASYALTGTPAKDDIIGYGFLRPGGGDDRPGPPILERIRATS